MVVKISHYRVGLRPPLTTNTQAGENLRYLLHKPKEEPNKSPPTRCLQRVLLTEIHKIHKNVLESPKRKRPGQAKVASNCVCSVLPKSNRGASLQGIGGWEGLPVGTGRDQQRWSRACDDIRCDFVWREPRACAGAKQSLTVNGDTGDFLADWGWKHLKKNVGLQRKP